MTTHTLRNLITILEWTSNTEGATLLYTRSDKPHKEFSWHVEPIELMGGLSAMGSIDEYTLSPHTVVVNGCTYTFDNFMRNYRLSQWEALNLSLRHEMEVEESKSINMLEIDTALKSLL